MSLLSNKTCTATLAGILLGNLEFKTKEGMANVYMMINTIYVHCMTICNEQTLMYIGLISRLS